MRRLVIVLAVVLCPVLCACSSYREGYPEAGIDSAPTPDAKSDSASPIAEASRPDTATRDMQNADTVPADMITPDMATPDATRDMKVPDTAIPDMKAPDTVPSDTVAGPTYSATATLFSLTQKAVPGSTSAPIGITRLFPNVSSSQDGPLPADSPFYFADATYRSSGGPAGCVARYFTGTIVETGVPVLPTPDVDVGNVLMTGWQSGNHTTTSVSCSFASGTYTCAPVCPGVDAGGCSTSGLGPFGVASASAASWFSGAPAETIQSEFLGNAGVLGPIGDALHTPPPTPMGWFNDEAQTTKSLGFVATAAGGGQLDTITLPSSGSLTLDYTCPGCTTTDDVIGMVTIIVTRVTPSTANPYPTVPPAPNRPFATVQCLNVLVGSPSSGTLVVPAGAVALLQEVGAGGQIMTLVAAGNGNANIGQAASPGSATWFTGVGSVGWNPTP
jgi:hypothetical protein